MPSPHDHTPPSQPAGSACGHAHHTPGQTDGHSHAEESFTAGHDHATDAHTHTHACSAEDHDHAHDAYGDDHAGHDHAAGGGCGHSHGFGHAHVHTPSSFGKAFAIGIAANSLYLVAEALWGFFSHSLALLADAGHNLSDVLALAAAWMAQHLSQRSPSLRFTYGLRRSSILAALANALVLMLVTGGVAWEAITRLFDPAPVAGKTMMIVAALGIVVNGATALLFASGQKGDLNIRAAFMHLMADAVTSLAVVIAGGLVLLTGLNWIDPAISLAISVVVVASTWSLLRDSLDMALDAVPRTVDAGAVEGFLRTLPGVADLHDLHIWPISTTETALTVHLVRTSAPAADNDTALLEKAAAALRERFGIVHPTLQIEAADYAPSCALTDPHTV